MGISVYPPASGGGGKSFIVETITGTGTWTCPSDVNQIEVILVGGGGGGTQYTPSNIWVMGGAGGDVKHEHLTVTPGATYTITIGGGGAYYSGGGGSGAAGAASTFDVLLTAAGGGGGFPDGGNLVSQKSYGLGSAVMQSRNQDAGSGIYYSGPHGLGGHGRGSNDSYGAYPAVGSGSTSPSVAAAANRGGGGGSAKNVSSSNGGSGVCIIKYWSAA